MSLNIDCKKATLYAAQKEEQKLGLWQQLQLWRHVAICSICKLFIKQTAVIEKAVVELEKNTGELTHEEQQQMIEQIERAAKD